MSKERKKVNKSIIVRENRPHRISQDFIVYDVCHRGACVAWDSMFADARTGRPKDIVIQ